VTEGRGGSALGGQRSLNHSYGCDLIRRKVVATRPRASKAMLDAAQMAAPPPPPRVGTCWFAGTPAAELRPVSAHSACIFCTLSASTWVVDERRFRRW